MALTGWALFALLTAAVLVGAVLHYRRHEPAGRGRYVLAGLRATSIVLILLLALDPVVPSLRGPGDAPIVALVDASLSMRLPSPDGTTRWEEAERVIADLDPDHILVFGSGPAQRVESLGDVRPDHPFTRLAPALAPVLETARARVVVITDGALEDATEVARVLGSGGGRLETRPVGRQTAGNLGMVEISAPGWATGDDPVEVTVTVARVGLGLPDSVSVSLWSRDRELARTRVAVPDEGRLSEAVLGFTPTAAMEGVVRLDARIEIEDAEPADDYRSVYLRLAEQPGGVVLVSFLPDQEPRFLLPVLERAAGIPARGWLALGSERFVRLGVGPEAGRSDAEAVVRNAVAGADLLVVHGLTDQAPAWARGAATTARRTLMFPRGPTDALPLALGPAASGDWYPVLELPASPIAAFLGAADLAAAPPVSRVHGVEPPPGWWTPLHVRQERRGTAYPTLVARDTGERRTAVALAEGYWRWAFAERAGRDLYDAYWAGVVAWLMEAPVEQMVDAVRPADRVVPRGGPLRWVAPRAADSVRVTLHPIPGPGAPERAAAGAGTRAPVSPLDTVLTVSGGSAIQPGPAPGHYRYEARAFLEAGGSADGVGEVSIERYSPEFTHLPRHLDLEAVAAAAGPLASPPGRPLRTLAWPYVALVVLLCVEWVLRRRWGLR